MDEQGRGRSGLNIGDSIGLISLVFAVIAFTLSPHVWLKTVFIVMAALGIVLAVRFSHWTYSWSWPRRFILSLLCALALIGIGVPQINDQLKSDHQKSLTDYYSWVIQIIRLQMRHAWVGRAFWLFTGAFMMIFFLVLVVALKAVRDRSIVSQQAKNGFLDYKLQAENAIISLPAALAPITAITFNVGKMIEAQTRQVQAAAQKPTVVQLRVVKRTATKLDVYSRQIHSRCSLLEGTGARLEEGMLGWFAWIKSQNELKPQLIQVIPTLQVLGSTVASTILKINDYIRSMEANKGISRDMNIALEAHIQAVTRVRDASIAIQQSCMSALRFIDAQEQENK
jgi:hypothetical protein